MLSAAPITLFLVGASAYLVLSELLNRPRSEPGVVVHRWTFPVEIATSAIAIGLTFEERARAGTPPPKTLVLLGIAVFLAGAALRRRAKHDLGKYWSKHIEIRSQQRVVDRGIYAYIRHPAYLGLILEVLALPIGAGSARGLLACVGLFVPAVLLRFLLEEATLEVHLPAYRLYRQTTSAFIPGMRVVESPPVEPAPAPEAAPLPARVRGLRIVFALVGFAIAAGSFFFVEPAAWRAYLTFAGLGVVSYFLWVDTGPPITFFVLPYLATIGAFVYIGGLPIIGIDYLGRLLTFPVVLFLARRKIMRPPPYVKPMVDAWERGDRLLTDATVDSWTNHAIGAVGLAARYLCFHLLTGPTIGLDVIPGIVCSEMVGYGCQGGLNFLLPLPTSDWAITSAAAWRKLPIDSRIDILAGTILCHPPLVLLIYYGWAADGPLGAALGSFCTLGPHYLLRLLGDRRRALAEQHEAVQATSERLKIANRDLEDKAEALERKQEELRQFVYTVTHDLKNPLGALQITADLLRESDGEAISEEGREHLERIARLAGGTEDMIRDLLGFFKITSTPEPPGWVDLRGLVDRTLETLHPQITTKRVAVQVGALPRVWGQSQKLAHVVSNLLSNAVKYVPAQTGEVRLAGEVLNGHVVFSVRDNGIGIPTAYHNGIFELFGRVPGKEQAVEGSVVAGTGVGLAIVKRIVEAHDGRVWVESAPGLGSRFVVQLPAHDE
jgi:signal transduction histidine kinase/protein-S-isoprenylcysteine O-methyltransferase Ste14